MYFCSALVLELQLLILISIVRIGTAFLSICNKRTFITYDIRDALLAYAHTNTPNVLQ
jgi:hypothetical protein